MTEFVNLRVVSRTLNHIIAGRSLPLGESIVERLPAAHVADFEREVEDATPEQLARVEEVWRSRANTPHACDRAERTPDAAFRAVLGRDRKVLTSVEVISTDNGDPQ